MAIEQAQIHSNLSEKCAKCPLRHAYFASPEACVDELAKDAAKKLPQLPGNPVSKYQAIVDCEGPTKSNIPIIGRFLLGNCQLKADLAFYRQDFSRAATAISRPGEELLVLEETVTNVAGV